MKLNIFSKSLLLAGALAMVACSDDAPVLDDPNNGNGNAGDGYYMSLSVQLPSDGSRSQTTTGGQSTDGNEVGLDYENVVNDVLIVLANAEDNSFITAASVASSKLTPITSVNGYKSIAKIDKTALSEFYENNRSRNINVFVFCNPTADLTTLIKNTDLGNYSWVNATCEVIEGNGQSEQNTGIWAKDGFLMSNNSIAERELPATIDEWKKYNTEALAFDLSGVNSAGQDGEVDNSNTKGRGSILVQRAVARFDFKDGSKLGNNTYNVIYTLDADNKQVPLFNVQLDRIMLTNEAKQFYYLPRVSANGQQTIDPVTGRLSNATLCGSEIKTNYVVGPYYNVFNKGIYNTFADYFNFPFFDKQNENDYKQWSGAYKMYIDDVLGNSDDNLSEEDPDNTIRDYKIWRYVTENVIPANNDNQTMSRTTMVVFKGHLIAAEAAFTSEDTYTKAMAEAIGDGTEDHPTTLTGDPTKDPVIYYFNNSTYFGWENIKQAAIESALQFNDKGVPVTDEDGNLVGVRRSTSLYLAVFGDGSMGKFTWGTTEYDDSPEDLPVDKASTNYLYDAYQANPNDETKAAMKNAIVNEQLIGIYETSIDSEDGPGYYFYYYYKNRHNDNLDNGTMGAMEFATVRNNVYKLAVTNIASLGHPRIPENDPDKPTPDTPDESDDIYITVTCRVLPWVVRVNNIEF